LISGILIWVADIAFKTNLGLAANILLLVSVLSVFIFNSGTGIGSKIMGGLGSLWGLIGFFADILSFTRLIAVGLTGGIIGSVINLLSSLIYTAIPIPFINFVVLLGVLLIGHLFNFVISVFGAYINPLRLSYVEYLPKFLSGSERNMMPEKISLTYHKLPFEKY
jgi:V/A-type H+/Na+-transporting ATPase subunit I